MNALLRWALVLVAAAGLGIDAFTHLDLASQYRFISSGTVNQGVLFQIEGALAIAAGLWLLVRPGVLSILFTLAVAGGGAAALLVYRYVEVGKIGPIPDMHEAIWFPEKEWALAGELIAVAAGLVLLGLTLARRRSPRTLARSVAAQ